MAEPAPERERLAQLMDDRRTELRLRWEDVAFAGHISVKVLSDIRGGRGTPRRNTLRGIDAGLQWQPGSAEAILSGGSPAALDGQPAYTPRTPLGNALAQRRSRYGLGAVDEFARSAGVSVSTVASLETGQPVNLSDGETAALAAAYRLTVPEFETAQATGELPADASQPSHPERARTHAQIDAMTPDQYAVVAAIIDGLVESWRTRPALPPAAENGQRRTA